jgi:hypothetical protein
MSSALATGKRPTSAPVSGLDEISSPSTMIGTPGARSAEPEGLGDVWTDMAGLLDG